MNETSNGDILYAGKRINGKKTSAEHNDLISKIQMIFQDPAASLNERATVDYIISEGLYNFHHFEDDADRKRKVAEMMTEVGLLPEHLTRYPHEFSGDNVSVLELRVLWSWILNLSLQMNQSQL